MPEDRLKAARLIYAGFLRGSYWAKDALSKPDLGDSFLRTIQRLLIRDGFYRGVVNGRIDARTAIALDEAYNTISMNGPFDVDAVASIVEDIEAPAELPSCSDENCT